MDIISEIGTSRKYNLHSHTQFCDGRATMEDFAKEAVAQGFTHYGFSPHSPVPIKSACNMDKDDVPAYLAEVERIRSVYGGNVKFYASMEIDYLGHEWGPSNRYFSSLPLDYRIGSVHFIPSQDGNLVDIDGSFDNFKKKLSDHFHNDIRYVVNTFYLRSQNMLSAGGFDIIGHFDKVGHNAGDWAPGIEDEPWYKKLVNDLIDTIISTEVTVEINTKAWERFHRLFPSERYIRRLSEAHVPIVVNSDAHYPSLINSARDHAFSILDKIAGL